MTKEEMIDKFKKEYAHNGKSKQWQYGFDAGMKEVGLLVDEINQLKEKIDNQGHTIKNLISVVNCKGV